MSNYRQPTFSAQPDVVIRPQDPLEWVREGLVDFVCPMIYTESDATCAAALDTPSATLVAGIGTGADESQLDASGTALQIGHSRARRLAGFAFFAVDEELCASILPRLFPPPVP